MIEGGLPPIKGYLFTAMLQRTADTGTFWVAFRCHAGRDTTIMSSGHAAIPQT
jgi:hypothetical protein